MFTISVTAHRKIGTFWFSPTVENYERELSFKKIKGKNLVKTQTAKSYKNKNTIASKKKKHKMENDPLKQFAEQLFKDLEKKKAVAKRKKYFQEIGRKGGLKKKTSGQFTKVVSTRLTEKEHKEASQKAARLNLTLSKYSRYVITEKEVRVREFETDKILLEYGNHFIRIKNLLRHREFSKLDHTSQILKSVEKVTQLIYEYIYSKKNLATEENSQDDE